MPTDLSKYNPGIRNGKNDAFKQLFFELFAALQNYANYFVQSQQVAEELVQESFLKLWEQRHRVDDAFNLKAYLYKSIHNQALNYLRHQGIVKNHEKNHSGTIQPNQTGGLPAPFLKEAIEIAINELPSRTQVIFKLSRLNGYRHKEIAEKLSITEKTVEVQVRKARLILREKLKDYYKEL